MSNSVLPQAQESSKTILPTRLFILTRVHPDGTIVEETVAGAHTCNWTDGGLIFINVGDVASNPHIILLVAAGTWRECREIVLPESEILVH